MSSESIVQVESTEIAFQHRAFTPAGEHGTFYFAYGSNLSPTQMRIRCTSTPDRSSRPLAIARLSGWRWYIDQRGCANISRTNEENDEVWGVIYDMSIEDEKTLDGYEGVDWTAPLATEDGLGTNILRPTEQGMGRHNKVYVNVEVVYWRDESWRERLGPKGKLVVALAYPDEYRKEPGIIRPNYIGRMNRAIQEAVALGLSKEWVAKVVRPTVPEGIEAPEGYVGEKDKPVLT